MSSSCQFIQSGVGIFISDSIQKEKHTPTQNVKTADVLFAKNNEALKILNDKELLVISYMFGINGYDEIKQKDIATILGMQQGSVSRIGKRAINKMKYYLKVNRGVDYGR